MPTILQLYSPRQPLFVGIATPVCLTRKVAVANLSVERFVERDVAPKLLREPHTAGIQSQEKSFANNTKSPHRVCVFTQASRKSA